MGRSSLLRNLAAAVVIASALAGWIALRHRPPAPEDAFARRRAAFLEAENGRLAAALAAKFAADDLAATRTRQAEIERTIARLRALEFTQPVTYREIGRDQLPAILRQKLLQQVPEQEFADAGLALAALGLLPAGTDLQKTYLALLGEQIGAFYDQHSHELYTFSGRPLSNAQNRVVLAHELTHALQDQHFNLARLPLETKGNDDRALAASALVEGDATLAMNQYMIGDLTAAALKDTLATALTTDVRELAAAPKFLRETLLFPYLSGLGFCQALYDEGGWAALAAAYAHPPSSTAQILHPGERGEPVEVDLPDDPVLGRRPFVRNVLGEFGARQLLATWLHDEERAAAVAAGWRGDRYAVYGDAKAASFVWRIACLDQKSARDFAAAAAECLDRRHRSQTGHAIKRLVFPPGAEPSPGDGYSETTSASINGRELRTCATFSNEVIVIDAQDGRWLTALAERFAAGASFPP